MTRGLVIGSVAAKKLIPTWRDPKDFDVFTDDPGFFGDRLPLEPFWHPKLADWIDEYCFRAATLDELYTVKVSHLQWELSNGSWEKHIEDAMALKAHGAKLLPEFHKVLVEIWTAVHGRKRVDLTQDKDAFFADAVPRRYDHDSIHYSVAYGDHPLYEDVMKDGASVQTDMRKVWALPFADQVRLFREEIYATALERWVIPADYRCSPRRAYALALRKTIVSLTKGKSSLFLIENYDTFRKPDRDYVKHHRSKSHHLIEINKGA
jgi:hypothetical protein